MKINKNKNPSSLAARSKLASNPIERCVQRTLPTPQKQHMTPRETIGTCAVRTGKGLLPRGSGFFLTIPAGDEKNQSKVTFLAWRTSTSRATHISCSYSFFAIPLFRFGRSAPAPRSDIYALRMAVKMPSQRIFAVEILLGAHWTNIGLPIAKA